jgi:1,2-dihydroxy-3-keto-5-methylthiopentene dioxygenase
MRAYYYDNTDLDQRELHDSGKSVSIEELKNVGVLYWSIVGDNAIEELDKVAAERSYKNRDQVRMSIANMMPDYFYIA